jgi:RNA recognition motif-containing protein
MRKNHTSKKRKNEPPDRTVVMKDLSFFCRKDDILRLFNEFIPDVDVEYCKIWRNGTTPRYCGSVVLRDSGQVDRVIEILHGKLFMGRYTR